MENAWLRGNMENAVHFTIHATESFAQIPASNPVIKIFLRWTDDQWSPNNTWQRLITYLRGDNYYWSAMHMLFYFICGKQTETLKELLFRFSIQPMEVSMLTFRTSVLSVSE